MRLYMEPWLGSAKKVRRHSIARLPRGATASPTRSRTDMAKFAAGHDPVGKHDEWILLARGEELARRIPNAGFRVVAETKHLVQEEAPEAIVATVLDFLPRAR
jgi:pimeloyl-ACP methyl ester carboxylesterase